MPWQSGLTGIAYNAELHRRGRQLLASSSPAPTSTGKVTLLTEMRDTMGFMLKVVGADPENFNDDEWHAAIDELGSAVSAGQIRQFTGNKYVRLLGQRRHRGLRGVVRRRASSCSSTTRTSSS